MTTESDETGDLLEPAVHTPPRTALSVHLTEGLYLVASATGWSLQRWNGSTHELVAEGESAAALLDQTLESLTDDQAAALRSIARMDMITHDVAEQTP